MGTKKLWVVTVSTEVVVYAENVEEAGKIVRKENAIVESGDFLAIAAHPLCSLDDLPSSWDGECLAWGAPDYETVATLLAEQTAETQANSSSADEPIV